MMEGVELFSFLGVGNVMAGILKLRELRDCILLMSNPREYFDVLPLLFVIWLYYDIPSGGSCLPTTLPHFLIHKCPVIYPCTQLHAQWPSPLLLQGGRVSNLHGSKMK